MPTPAADFAIDRPLVATLLREQHADLASLPLGERFEGWDNVSIRLGDELLVRLPRRALAVELIRREHHILPGIADRLDVAVPVPLRTGEPSPAFEAPWSVVPWIPGRTAARARLGTSQAARLGETLRRVHAAGWGELPRSPYRGQPLASVLDPVSEQLRRVRANGVLSDAELARALTVWTASAAVPFDEPDVLIHGDLHPRNIVVDGEEIVGIIDWGDATPGDRAVDLCIGWSLFEAPGREALWRAYGGVAPRTLERSRGWALRFAALWIDDAGDVEEFVHAGRRTIERVLADA